MRNWHLNVPLSLRNAFSDVDNLPAAFAVWLTTPKADFLKGRMVWCNWDVDELMAKKKEIVEHNLLKTGIKGFPVGA